MSRAIILALLAGLFATVRRLNPIGDPDYFWHLATGRYILRDRAIPTVDPFSHTFAGEPWHFVDWLADIILFNAYDLGGHALVIITTALLAGTTIALATWTATRSFDRWPIAIATALLATTAVISRATPRPQTFAFLLAATQLALLEHARRDRRALIAVPIAVALWQNLHASAPLGLLIALAYAIAAPRDRARWLTAAATALALFATPRPIDRLLAGFEHGTDPRIPDFITEWAPFWTIGWRAPSGIAFMLLAALAAASLLHDRRHLDRPLIAFGLTILAIKSNRFVPFAAIALLPLAFQALQTITKRSIAVLATAGAIILQTWQLQPLGLGLVPGAYPEGATAFIQKHAPIGAMYNSFRFGGYLIFTLEGRHPVFIDGRSFALYGVDFTQSVIQASPSELDTLLDRHNVSFAVLVNTNAAMNHFQSRDDWSLVYFDDIAFIAVRNAENATLALQHAYQTIHPARWVGDIARLKQDPRSLPAARAEADRAQREAPSSALAKTISAAIALAAGDLTKADRESQLALELNPDYVPALGARLMTCVERKDQTCACDIADRLLDREPDNTYAQMTRANQNCAN